MNFQLFGILLILTFFTWFVNKRDIFAPSVVLCTIFTIVAYFSMLVNKTLEVNLELETFNVLLIGFCGFILGTLFVKFYEACFYKGSYTYLKSGINYIHVKNLRLIKVACILMFAISVIGIFFVARSLTSSGITGLIYAYRLNLLAGSNTLPGVISNLILINYAIGYIAIYILLNNFFAIRKIEKTLLPLIVLPAITGLLQGARGNAVQYFLFGIIIYYYFYTISKQKRNINGRFLIKIGFILLGGVWVFFLLKTVIGRQNELGFFEYVGGHLCAPVKLLDVYIKENHAQSSIWGLETFTNLISTVRRWMGLSGIKYGDYANYRIIDGVSYGNVYTAFRAYYADFGIIGVFVCSYIIGSFSSVFYEEFRRKKFKIGVNWSLFVYAYLVYGIAMMFYSNTFFEYVANISFLKMIFVWLVFNKAFIKNKKKLCIAPISI